MKTDAGPSASPRLPSSTATSKVSRSPANLGLRNTTTASVTFEPSLLKADTVALGGSLAKLPVFHSSTRSVVGRCPAMRAGRLAKRTADCATPSRVRLGPASLAPCALSTISASDCLRACGTPMVFCAGWVMALGAVPDGVCAKHTAGERQQRMAAQRRMLDMLVNLGVPGD